MDIVPNIRQTIWNPGIYGGIPPDSANASTFPNGVGPCTKYGATLTPSGGDDTSAIKTALSNAANAGLGNASKSARRYVQLGSGTFLVSSNIVIPSYVILRGTMVGNTRSTIIKQTTIAQGTVTITGSFTEWGTMHEVQGTLKKGDSTITLDTVVGLSVGDLIALDQYADGDRSGKNGVLDWSGGVAVVTTGINRNWTDTPSATDACVFSNSSLYEIRYDQNTTIDNGAQDFPQSAGQNGDTDRGWRPIMELMRILAIDGHTITVYQEPTTLAQDGLSADLCGNPVRMWYYPSALDSSPPEVYRVCGTAAGGDQIEYAGIEDLTIYPWDSFSVLVNRAQFCWIKNVESSGLTSVTGNTTTHRHFKVENFTYRCEVTECYTHDQSSYFPGGSYGINIQGGEHYVHNNVCNSHNKPINLEVASGCVLAYNYTDDAIIDNDSHNVYGWQESGIGTHASFCHNNLIEGNDIPNFTQDSTHGNNGFQIAFRNHLRGQNTGTRVGAPWKAADSLERAIMTDWCNWEMTSIGNICFMPTYRATGVLRGDTGTLNWFGAITNPSIYLCGMNGWASNGGSKTDYYEADGFAASNLYYHKDYHYVTTGDGLYEDAQNPHDLPLSLHRTSTPTYFSGQTWPPFDPEAANYSGVEGASKVTDIPAKLRLEAGEA